LIDAASTTLSLSTNPDGVVVFLNGDSLGLTPLVAYPAKTGRLPLRMRKTNYLPIDTVVVITPGRKTALAFSLQPAIAPSGAETLPDAPQFGYLQILSQPLAANIFINDQPRGKTPLTLKNLTPGRYRIVLNKAGYQDFLTSITVEAGKEKKIDERLVQLMGKQRVVAKPSGSVYIDGESKRETTFGPYETDLPGGPHLVKVIHPSWGYWEKEVNIK
jgi:hypothetical protein